jgi:hypothetical protein
MREDHGERGVTAVELACAMFALVVLSGSIVGVMGGGIGIWRSSTLRNNTEKDANRALEGIVTHLSWAGRDSVLACFETGDHTDTLEYRPVTGCTEGTVLWGGITRIGWVPEPSDPPDGEDNDGNGLVDEGMVVMIRNLGQSDETETVLVRGVARLLEGEVLNDVDDNGNGLSDEGGLCFERRGDSVAVRITLCRRGGEGVPVTRTAETSVTPRN